jgi:hypothetical protein
VAESVWRVRDELWEIIEPPLPAHRPDPRGGRPRVDDRVCFNAIVFVLVGMMAAVLGGHGSHPSQVACSVKASHPAPATAEGRASRRVAASTLCECIAGPLSHRELDHIGVRLEAHLDEVAARPAGCGVPA